MMVVGITGGIGSGKSIVCEVFRTLGIPVYEADAEAKKLYEFPDVIVAVKKSFGPGYFLSSGTLDKKKLAATVFRDPAALEKINGIIHPFVKKHFREWKKMHADKRYVLKEAAILFESGTNKGCDFVIVVTAPAELRMKRVLERDGRDKEEVEKIMQQQWTEEEKVRRADFVIVNDGNTLILPQILNIHSKLLALRESTELSKS